MEVLQNSLFKNLAGFGLIILSVFSFHQVNAENFTVTGYYSPLPNQEFYLTGDYESEMRLNGKGIQGADGTEVYHGMIAAPKNYAFGTNICLDKLGCGTVHDRGGAIVNKGVRKKAVHDRIDFWMGHGVKGLERSLLWGVRSVGGSFGHKSAPKAKRRSLVERKMAVSPILLEVVRQKSDKKLFNKNLYPGANTELVAKLKESLKFLRFFRGKMDNRYDQTLKKSVLNFQLKHKVIKNNEEYGAGNFGPKTREKIEEVIRYEIDKKLKTGWKTNVFQKNMSYDDHDMDIFRLQQLLLDKGFLEATPTGYFGRQTESALKSFQLSKGLIRTKNSVGAGNFGPKTREKMTELWLAKRDSYFPVINEPVIQVVNEELEEGELMVQAGTKLIFLATPTPEVIEVDYFDDSVILFRGKRNADVRKLQKELKKLGFFTGNTTGFYGDETAEAVLSFQYEYQIVVSRRSIGASVFGPSTRAKMNEIMK